MDSSSHKKMSLAGPTIVVLGAGINGAALARQFVLNNANVIIADTRDIAGGTTAWSTRLIHGGLRYLEYGEFDLVRESLAERNRLAKIASHLVKPLRFAIPLRQRRGGMLAAAARILRLGIDGETACVDAGTWKLGSGHRPDTVRHVLTKSRLACPRHESFSVQWLASCRRKKISVDGHLL